MYEPHPLISTPPDDQPLWRYMNFVKFVAMLETQSLFFSRADRLGDPFEGSMTRIEVTRVQNESGEIRDFTDRERQDIARARRLFARNTFINSWYGRERDSAAMWELYETSTDGIAIRSTVGRLKAAIKDDDRPVYIGSVQYIDYETTVTGIANTLVPFFWKRDSFDHEHEARAAARTLQDQGPIGVQVPVDLGELIEEVVIAPQVEHWFANLVGDVMRRYGLALFPIHSPLAAPPNWGWDES